MARKKVVFIIVEGLSDAAALETLLTEIFSSNTVVVNVMRCDITTNLGVTPSNIKTKIAEVIKEYARQFGLKSVHFSRVIHLIDTDGAYVSDDCIGEDSTLAKTQYSETCIMASKKENIVDRNQRKRNNVNTLHTCPEIWSIPYSVYYMSCNLDHVLHNKLNSTDEEKETDAHAFAKKYHGDIAAFLKFICESDFSVMDGYMESWKFIKEGKHSLERHTNLGICFEDR